MAALLSMPRYVLDGGLYLAGKGWGWFRFIVWPSRVMVLAPSLNYLPVAALGRADAAQVSFFFQQVDLFFNRSRAHAQFFGNRFC